jgi:hypothetical protein
LEATSLGSTGISIFIVTEKDINATLFRSLEWVSLGANGNEDLKNTEALKNRIYDALQLTPDCSLAKRLVKLDAQHQEKAGMHLSYLKYLVRNACFTFDVFTSVDDLRCGDIQLVAPEGV